MTTTSHAHLTVGQGGSSGTRNFVETITTLKIDGVAVPIPHPITVMHDGNSWIVDDRHALAHGVADSYAEALDEYLAALAWLREELAESTHPVNRGQLAAIAQILAAIGR